MPDGVPVGDAAPVLGNTGRAPSLSCRLWWIASALPARLLGKRLTPRENDHPRRDIGLPERKPLQDYHLWDRW